MLVCYKNIILRAKKKNQNTNKNANRTNKKKTKRRKEKWHVNSEEDRKKTIYRSHTTVSLLSKRTAFNDRNYEGSRGCVHFSVIQTRPSH